jgi:hypothetical protein
MLQRDYLFQSPLMIVGLALAGRAGSSIAYGENRPAPKYGPLAVRLFDEREYIQQAPAPDFWALMPYHIAQPDDYSCSAASVAMLINALRAHRQLRATDMLATVESVVSSVPAPDWRDKLTLSGPGTTLDELAALVPRAAARHDLSDLRVELMRFESESAAALTTLRNLLADNERSDRSIILVNFLQKELTGDADGTEGHIAPLGAYDAGRDRVLIFDPDRRWYEPYWATTERLLAAMRTVDPVSQRHRGLVRVIRPE